MTSTPPSSAETRQLRVVVVRSSDRPPASNDATPTAPPAWVAPWAEIARPIGFDGPAAARGLVDAATSWVLFAPHDIQLHWDALRSLIDLADNTPGSVVHASLALQPEAPVHPSSGLHPLRVIARPEVLQGHDVLPIAAALFPVSLLQRIGGPRTDQLLGRWWSWELIQRAVWHAGLVGSTVVVGSGPLTPEWRRSGTVPPLQRAFAAACLRHARLPPFVDDAVRALPAPTSVAAFRQQPGETPGRQPGRQPGQQPPRPHDLQHERRPAEAHIDQGKDAMAGRRLPLVVYGRLDASSSLYFDALVTDPSANVLLLDESSPAKDAPVLAEAGAVVLVRDAPRFVSNGVLDLLDGAGVPAWYFTDDDFVALRSEHRELAAFRDETMELLVARCAGVVTTSDYLAEQVRARHPNADVRMWPLAIDRTLCLPRVERTPDTLRIGVMGGSFRARGARADVAPAIAEFAAGGTTSIELFVHDDLVEAFSALECHHVTFTRSFRSFVRNWQRLGLDVLVHPPATTANARGKTANAMLVAHYLGAIPIVAADPAYELLGEQHGVLICDNIAQWRASLERCCDDARAAVLRRALADHVTAHYPVARAGEVATSVLGRTPQWDAIVRSERHSALTTWLADRQRPVYAKTTTQWPSRRAVATRPAATLRWLTTGRSPEGG